ncbi:MAG: biotin--[acetyl-CoA-carboxylase] ligase [Candidatus Cryptobacteroides sp.]|nr:biotin--[acetyl-CoA-carboxylase] ligase [Bacteroidales bacterium]MDY6157616.1 biotin--[acetyl-CoA-carboxylase] ligase [Candidatus Cryptobacteroides sp.]
MAPLREKLEKVRIIWLDSAKSTNSELRMRLGELDNLSVIAAVEQTAGRGQGSHTWYSSPRTNLTFSILYRFPEDGQGLLKVADMLLVTQITTLGIRDYLLSKGITAGIKWPNDIWVGDRKICGILIENILDGDRIEASIVGIGLDVNEETWPEELPNPVSMKQLTGVHYELVSELEELCESISKRYFQSMDEEGRKSLEKEFTEHMFRLP